MTRLKPFLLWSLLTLFVLSAMRLVGVLLYLKNDPAFYFELLKALFLGFRFDLSAVCYALVLPLLIQGFRGIFFLPGLNRFFYLAFKVYFSLVLISFILITAFDLIYYSYFQDHLNIMIFGFFEDDTSALIRTLWKNYPVIWSAVGLVVLISLTWKIIGYFLNSYKKVHEHPAQMNIKNALISFLIFVSLALGARGSLGLFPLGVADATISNQPVINYLAFSGIHSLHRAFKLKARNRSSWDGNAQNYGIHDAKIAAQIILNRTDLPDSEDPLAWFQKKLPASTLIQKIRPHVVVFVMESFGSYWLDFQSSSFNILGELEPHFKQDLLFKNFIPSMAATIGSLSALMINTPHRPDGGFLTESRSLQVPFRTAPARIYHQAGYHTRFIYGGAIGWRDIDKFARTQGFESVEGDFDIEKKLHTKLERHDWGLFDEDVFKYVETTLAEATVPELILVMTTSNHPPYQLPSTYQPLKLEFPEKIKSQFNVDLDLAKARFLAFQYANQKLGEFLTRFKKSQLSENTIFAATGDHSFLIVNFSEAEFLQKWQVPLYLWIPPKLKPAKVDTTVFGSHSDLFPTLMSLSLENTTIPILGSNLLNPDQRHEALHFSRLSLSSNGAVVPESAKTTRYFSWQGSEQKLAPTNPNPQLEAQAARYKAMMSYLDLYYEYERVQSRKPSP